MKLLLIAEQRDGVLSKHITDLIGFADQHGKEQCMFLVGYKKTLPPARGTLYLCDAGKHGEYNPATHLNAIQTVVAREQPDLVVLLHSSYGADLAPRIAYALGALCITGVTEYRQQNADGTSCNAFVTSAYNGKLQRTVRTTAKQAVITIQPGLSGLPDMSDMSGTAVSVPACTSYTPVSAEKDTRVLFSGYIQPEGCTAALDKAQIIVCAGRGAADRESLTLVKALAKKLGGEHAATRPVIDANAMEASRQIGVTGQSTLSQLHLSCGASGALQHLAGITTQQLIAITTDEKAPISNRADTLVVADVKALLPLLLAKLSESKS